MIRSVKGMMIVLLCWGIGAGCSDDSTSCFAAGTQIATPTGHTAIDKLRVGDRVLAFDHRRGQVVTSSITRIFRHTNRPIRRLSIGGNRTIRVTDEHPFYDLQRGRYKAAQALSPGDFLLVRPSQTDDATAAKLITTRVTQPLTPSETGTVYNITVAGQHNYFAEGVLVHNKSPDVTFFTDSGQDRNCIYDGLTRLAGTSFPAVDGCNTCTCSGDAGLGVICTQDACDAGPG